ncbi:hypothetical protein PC116_g34781 [Phytophthora cactorum]|nr:hypothetical protein PC116_g34781 [Phytophthora cactorum]
MAASADLSVAPLVSYSRVDGMPCVRSGREFKSGFGAEVSGSTPLGDCAGCGALGVDWGFELVLGGTF